MNTVGIKHMFFCTANKELTAEIFMKEYGVSSGFIHEKTGFLKSYRLDSEEDTLTLAKKAIDLFRHTLHTGFESIELIVCVTQNSGKIKMPHLAAFIQDYIAPERPLPSFDISLGCSGWVYALDIVKSFMHINSVKNALLITCDPYSQIIDQTDKNTGLLFSDGASVTWLSSEIDQEWSIGKGVYGTNGAAYKSIYRDENTALQMNGRALFETVVKTIPGVIANTIRHNNLKPQEIDKYVIHQGSKFLVDYLSELMNLKDKMFFAASEVGNTISSSIPSVFHQIVKETDQVICVCAFGIGFSWACNILTRNKT